MNDQSFLPSRVLAVLVAHRSVLTFYREPSDSSRSHPDSLRHLAVLTHAGTAITGSYALAADRIRLSLRLLNTSSGEERIRIETVHGATTQLVELVETARRRIVHALAQSVLEGYPRIDHRPRLLLRHQFGICLVMTRAAAVAADSTIARTIRFPAALRDRLAADADRCGRSFEGQVIALLRRHYGEDVDIAPAPGDILTVASASLVDVSASEVRLLTRKLRETQG